MRNPDVYCGDDQNEPKRVPFVFSDIKLDEDARKFDDGIKAFSAITKTICENCVYRRIYDPDKCRYCMRPSEDYKKVEMVNFFPGPQLGIQTLLSAIPTKELEFNLEMRKINENPISPSDPSR